MARRSSAACPAATRIAPSALRLSSMPAARQQQLTVRSSSPRQTARWRSGSGTSLMLDAPAGGGRKRVHCPLALVHLRPLGAGLNSLLPPDGQQGAHERQAGLRAQAKVLQMRPAVAQPALPPHMCTQAGSVALPLPKPKACVSFSIQSLEMRMLAARAVQFLPGAERGHMLRGGGAAGMRACTACGGSGCGSAQASTPPSGPRSPAAVGRVKLLVLGGGQQADAAGQDAHILQRRPLRQRSAHQAPRLCASDRRLQARAAARGASLAGKRRQAHERFGWPCCRLPSVCKGFPPLARPAPCARSPGACRTPLASPARASWNLTAACWAHRRRPEQQRRKDRHGEGPDHAPQAATRRRHAGPALVCQERLKRDGTGEIGGCAGG